MQHDRQVSFGISIIPKEYISFGSNEFHAYTPYITINFLPFVEASLRLTRLINYQGNTQAIGDRTPSLRIRLFEEKGYSPAVVFGLHDLITAFGGESAVHNNALYIVTSKHLSFDSFLNEVGLHLGYGVDWMHATNHNFVGLFGGFTLNFLNVLELMEEFDGTYYNSGIRIKLFNHFSLLSGFLRNKHFSYGASFFFSL